MAERSRVFDNQRAPDVEQFWPQSDAWAYASLALAEVDDAIEIITDNTVVGGIIAGQDADDVAAVAAAATIGATIAGVEASDTSDIATATQGVSGAIAATETADTSSFTTSATLGGAITATESSDVSVMLSGSGFLRAGIFHDQEMSGGMLFGYQATALNVTSAWITGYCEDDSAAIASCSIWIDLPCKEVQDQIDITSYCVGQITAVEVDDTAVMTGQSLATLNAVINTLDEPDVVDFHALGDSTAGSIFGVELDDTAAIVAQVITTGQIVGVDEDDRSVVLTISTLEGQIAAVEQDDLAAVTGISGILYAQIYGQDDDDRTNFLVYGGSPPVYPPQPVTGVGGSGGGGWKLKKLFDHSGNYLERVNKKVKKGKSLDVAMQEVLDEPEEVVEAPALQTAENRITLPLVDFTNDDAEIQAALMAEQIDTLHTTVRVLHKLLEIRQ